ncbi:MAG: hypothetical protein KC657_13755 [Myxococcales bacterium]|nr:hypothetical protein [Myxococcales bacterium]
MTYARRFSPGPVALLSVLAIAASPACKDKDKDTGAGLVVDAGVTSAAVPSAAPAVDINQCPGCQLAPVQAWEFAGVYKDPACTEPLAQVSTPACAAVPALGQVSLTYVDEVGKRKAGATGTVTLTAQVTADMPRYRKSGKNCVKANEAAVDITPGSCAGQRVCRDASGALACAGCRTFTSGCPDFEETRMYATIDDPELGGTKTAGGGNANLARLRQCCAALAAEARRLGASPEAGVLMSAAAQCNALVAQAGPSGNAPELGALRGMLAGRNVPAVCSGF